MALIRQCRIAVPVNNFAQHFGNIERAVEVRPVQRQQLQPPHPSVHYHQIIF